MIILDATTKSLEVILPGAITTNQLPWTTAFVDVGATVPLVENDGATNSGTAVTVVAAPLASNQRLVKAFTIINVDTVSQKVTLRINNNGTFRNIFVATLAIGDNLVYTADGGFQIFDLNGNVKQSLLTLPLGVGSGGTGDTTLTNHGVLLGQGTSPVVVTSIGATNTVLHGNTGADPTFSAVDLTADVTGTLPVNKGGTGAATFTAHGVMLGEGTSPLVPTAVGATNTLLHGNTGADPSFSAVIEADITLANNITNNVSSSAHGFAPVSPNDATLFLNGGATPAYSDPFDYLKLQVFG